MGETVGSRIRADLVIIRHVTDTGPRPVDPIDRAHLTGTSRPSPPIYRYAPGGGLEPLVQRYWIPVWSVEEPQRQSTLQHPACLVVVSNTYARFYGVVRGLSSVTLEGTGWAVGTMLTPAAGSLLLDGPVTPVTDTYVDLDAVPALDAPTLVARVRAAMEPDPTDPGAHGVAIAEVERQLAPLLPLDPQGLLVNDVVTWLRDHPEVSRVGEVAEAFATSERTLQRLVLQRVGMTPKWLVQRRRLHDAVERLKAGTTSLAAMAAELGYADQAHFTQDFRTVTGMTPGRYLDDQPR
ncbi:AraC family transcriptional regulator [Nocardioides euryhalodurans]|uniref:AraC family transcriptional regulator n=1 Tax=Nocardioides euryhalodurans TaxID=2518370 RepID=A0A4P7GPZ3_9ACTN|nr:AraC family transcriptional regulator [Nocardioides euryhalodurans]